MNLNEIFQWIVNLLTLSFSGITLFLSIYEGRRSEKRQIFRKLMDDEIGNIGRALHEVIACTDLALTKATTSKGQKRWRQEAARANAELHKLRLKLHYPIKPFCEEFKIVTQIPIWATKYKDKEKSTKNEFLELANTLIQTIDHAFYECYLTGCSVSKRYTKRIKHDAIKLKRFHQNQKPSASYAVTVGKRWWRPQ